MKFIMIVIDIRHKTHVMEIAIYVKIILSFRIEFFKEAGEIVEVRLSVAEDGSFKGFGHVEFATEEVAKKVYHLPII